MDRVISILASAIVDVVELRRVWDRIKPIPRNATDECSEYNPKIGPLRDLHPRWHSSYFSSTKRSNYKKVEKERDLGVFVFAGNRGPQIRGGGRRRGRGGSTLFSPQRNLQTFLSSTRPGRRSWLQQHCHAITVTDLSMRTMSKSWTWCSFSSSSSNLKLANESFYLDLIWF